MKAIFWFWTAPSSYRAFGGYFFLPRNCLSGIISGSRLRSWLVELGVEFTHGLPMKSQNKNGLLELSSKPLIYGAPGGIRIHDTLVRSHVIATLFLRLESIAYLEWTYYIFWAVASVTAWLVRTEMFWIVQQKCVNLEEQRLPPARLVGLYTFPLI